jgi:soluble lytic murein transglycosylase
VKLRTWIIILIVLVIDAGILWWWQGYRLARSQDAVIRAAAEHYDVEPALVKAVVWRESRFDADARGTSGELGLMQIRAAAAGEWAEAAGISDFHHAHLLNATSNTLCGAWYLRTLLDRYPHTDDPVAYALADYNAGRSNVLKWNIGTAETNSAAFIENIDFPMTREYVEAVKKKYEAYRGKLE